MRKLIFILAVLSIAGCKSVDKADNSVPVGFTPATITDYRGLDGCGFLLVTDDSTRYEPTNLDADFQKNGLQVYFRFKTIEGMSICMTGKQIFITEIRKINP